MTSRGRRVEVETAVVNAPLDRLGWARLREIRLLPAVDYT